VPGDGCIDFPAALKPIADAGYDGWLIVEAEQDPVKAHPLTYASNGFSFLKATAERVGFKVAAA
jgi:inosose dehydratase